MNSSVHIAVVGTGYVGLVAAVCFAELGHSVVCVDNDQDKVAALQNGDCLIHEQWLPELLGRYRNLRVRFTSDLGEATREAQAIFIAVGTPQSDAGNADLSYVEAVTNEIARSIKNYTVIVEKSTVPVYTNEWIRRVMERNGVPRHLFDVISNPEFLREGTAIADFLHPDRIVVGTDSERAALILKRIYAPLTNGIYYARGDAITGSCTMVTPPTLLLTSTKSAEIIKHASNAFLAMKISFINAVSTLCEAADANVEQVARGMGLDSRIGHRFLKPGIGYGGSCFPKDVAAFRCVAEQLGVNFALLNEVEKINADQKMRFLGKVRAALWTLRGKKLGVLGLAFKGGTDDIDPAAMGRAKKVLEPCARLQYMPDAYSVTENVDALLILTDWAEFGEMDLRSLKKSMRYPIVIDGRNMYDPETMLRNGITYFSVGRPVTSHTDEVAVA